MHVRLLGLCFKTGQMGSPHAFALQCPKGHTLQCAVTGCTSGGCWGHLCPPCFDCRSNRQQSAPRAKSQTSIIPHQRWLLGAPMSPHALTVGPTDNNPHHEPSHRPALFHIGPRRIAGPHRLPCLHFQALFDSLFIAIFIFPTWYVFAISVLPIFSLG
jgi:hypothetical protein